MELEDIPEIKEGIHIKVEICHSVGAALNTQVYYITSKANIGTKNRPAIQVFEGIAAGSVYYKEKPLYLSEIIRFEVQESVK